MFGLTAGLAPPGGATVQTPGTIVAVAGTGDSDYTGDGGLATAATLNDPFDVALDADGNVYIADNDNNAIRKVDGDGIITTVAGDSTGGSGSTGDGGPAVGARLNNPYGVAVDPAGNLYIADSFNHRIRKVDTDGNITTVAGGSNGYSGDGGPATDAELDTPYGVALDGAGNLYISDTYNHVIRMVDTDGIITTVAGTGSYGFAGDGGPATDAEFQYPRLIDVDAQGRIFIPESSNDRIRRVDTDGIITTIAGIDTSGDSGDGGPATDAELNGPYGVALDADGGLFVADRYNYRVRRVQVQRFDDVGANHQFYDDIQWMAEAGISTGGQLANGDTVYQPGAAVKRQAMAAFLYRLAGEPSLDEIDGQLFDDVAPSHPFYDPIQWMGATGISTGSPDPDGSGTVFLPNAIVKRQAMAAFLHRIQGALEPM